MTYSFPCTDLSVAGRMKGMSKEDWESGNSTRSGLLWEVERILKECTELPDVLLMENVPMVHSDQNKKDFDSWCNFLKSKGYINHWQDLNAKDYGIPQNRDRCFMVSILSDNFIDFEFPKPVKLQKVMRDYLEDKVDEKYYIKNEKAQKLIKELVENGTLNRTEQNRTDYHSRLTSRQEEVRKSQSHLVLPQGMTLESVNTNLKEPVFFRGFRSRNIKPSLEKIDVAHTILSSEFKGIQNMGTNGVIEWS